MLHIFAALQWNQRSVSINLISLTMLQNYQTKTKLKTQCKQSHKCRFDSTLFTQSKRNITILRRRWHIENENYRKAKIISIFLTHSLETVMVEKLFIYFFFFVPLCNKNRQNMGLSQENWSRKKNAPCIVYVVHGNIRI